jgi:hypothetical protein
MGPVYQPERRQLGDACHRVDPWTETRRRRLLREITSGHWAAAVADGGNAWNSGCE